MQCSATIFPSTEEEDAEWWSLSNIHNTSVYTIIISSIKIAQPSSSASSSAVASSLSHHHHNHHHHHHHQAQSVITIGISINIKFAVSKTSVFFYTRSRYYGPLTT
jgi:hypothetical protein